MTNLDSDLQRQRAEAISLLPVAGPTTLYMIRHGETAEEHRGRLYGQLDVELSERGVRQSAAVAERLSGVPFHAVYSSDLTRAQVMAEALGEVHDLPVRTAEVFRERSMGILQGLTYEEMEQREPEIYAAWKADKVRYRVAEGENFEDLQSRVVPAVLDLVASFAGRRIALATHAGPIRVMLAHALGMPLECVYRFGLDFACVNVIEFSPNSGSPPIVKMVNG